MIINSVWNLPRIVASSRVLAFIYLPIILLSLKFNIQDYNKLFFLGLSVLLLIYLILVAYRALDKNFTGGLKLRKVFTLLIMATMTYGFFYYAMINYDINAFKSIFKTEQIIEKDPFSCYFDMTFFSMSVITTIGYNYDLNPKHRFVKFIVMTQILCSIVLLMILLSKAI